MVIGEDHSSLLNNDFAGATTTKDDGYLLKRVLLMEYNLFLGEFESAFYHIVKPVHESIGSHYFIIPGETAQ